MSQNLFAYIAKAVGGGAAALNVDENGALVVTTDGVAAAAAVSDSSGDVANTDAVATLPGATNLTTFIQGIALTGMGATAAGSVVATVTGLAGGDLSFVVPVPVGATVGVQPLIVQFEAPLPASAEDTDIVVTLPALGAGNLHACATAWGVQR